jgi:hypothetical protein
MHDESPNIVHLAVHLQGQQTVYIPRGANIPRLLTHAHTTLTAWFQFNLNKVQQWQQTPDTVPHVCLNTLYHDFPTIATWDRTTKQWTEHQRDEHTGSYRYSHKGIPVGCMYFVKPSENERYYLRLLLATVPGATSYADL